MLMAEQSKSLASAKKEGTELIAVLQLKIGDVSVLPHDIFWQATGRFSFRKASQWHWICTAHDRSAGTTLSLSRQLPSLRQPLPRLWVSSPKSL